MKSIIADAIIAALMLSGTAVADTIDVPGDYPSIQGAIDASADGDVVQVAKGIYFEYIRPNGKAITIQGSLGPDGQHLTTIDAEQASTVVLFESGEDQETVLRDLVITGGGGVLDGGGIECLGSSPKIENCIIRDNYVTQSGAGIFCQFNSSPLIQGCVITNNQAPTGGGVTCFQDSNPALLNCSILNNQSYAGSGGGIYCRFSSPSLEYCLIAENNSYGNLGNDSGGGIYCGDGSSPAISYCTIRDNTANQGGGGLHVDVGKPSILGTLVCGNSFPQVEGTVDDKGGNEIEDSCPFPVGACCTGNDIICVQNVREQDCLTFGGQWLGIGAYCSELSCPSDCLGDADGDGEVNVNDILLVIARYGVACP